MQKMFQRSSLNFHEFVKTITLIFIIADDACELKVNNGSVIQFLSINKTWSSSDDPCTLYKCTDKSGIGAHIDVERIECDTSCANDQVYKTIASECCGKCYSTFCTVGEKKFKTGEIWKSSDKCTVNECIDTGTDLIVTSYKKSCPKLKNCPEDSIEMRDCCPYCNYRSQSEFLFSTLLTDFDHLKLEKLSRKLAKIHRG